MAALDSEVALLTTADVDVELAADCLSWNLNLILLIDVSWLDRTTAVGAGIGYRRLVDLVNLLQRRSMRLGTIILAGLASRLFWVGLGWSFGEGSGLTLAGALLLFKQAGEAFDLSLQFGDAALQRLAAGTSEFVHAGKIAKLPASSCASARFTPRRRLKR
jgi:hypothetical protein